MKIYYLSMFLLTVLGFLIICYKYEIRKTNYFYMIMIMLMMVSNAGYLAVALSRNMEEAILADKIVYIGGCFIPPATLSLICTLTNYRLASWIKSLIYGVSGFIYGMVLTIGYSDLFYQDVYLKSYKDVMVMGHGKGIGYKLFYMVLIGHAVMEICLIFLTIVKRRKISLKNLIGLSSIVIINIYLFIVGKYINPSVEITPLTYAISCGVLVFMYRKGSIYNFDDNISNSQKRNSNAYIMFDERLNFLGCNPMAEQIFPQLAESVVDRPLDNEMAAKYLAGWIHEFDEGKEKVFTYENENAHYVCEVEKMYHKGKHHGYMVEMRDNTGEWKYLSLLSSHTKELEYEVEKQQRIAKELELAKIEAEGANEAKSQFLARMSHEIRTPINAVMGMNEMILRESEEKGIKKYAHDIKTATETLLGMVNEILDTSKIDAGMMEIIPGSYEIATLLNDLYSIMIVKAQSKNLELIFEVDPDIPGEYWGDDVRIKQVLINLLNNGVKYTNEGSVTLRISCTMAGTNAILHYRVIDTGIGIKEEDFEKLFEKFERVEKEKNRNIEGTGLGLNIASRLLNLMGSELKVKSEYQKGSEFYFDIKQKIVDIEPIGDFRDRIQLVEESEDDNILYVAPEAKVLIVDDNSMNRDVFAGLLKPTRMKVFEAASGEECITILQERKFDIVFLDHMMPGMDGMETFRIIKKKKLCEETPVIMFTANVMAGEREKFLNEGFKDFLAKPIIPEKLDEMMIKYLPKELVRTENIQKAVSKERALENLPQLEEFDFGYALGLLKSEELLMQSLENFRDMLKYIPEKLKRLLEGIEQEESLKNYRIEVHALKGTSATVGALLLSKIARLLEVAAAHGEIAKIKTLNPILLEEIAKHEKRMSVLFPEEKQEMESKELIESYLDMLGVGLMQEDYDTADFMLEEIKKYRYPKEVQLLIDELAGQVLNMESVNAIETLERIQSIL